MDIPTIINHNYYIVRDTKINRTWICEAERFDDKESKLYYHYGTYELGSDEHKNNHYLSNSYYDVLPKENDEIRLATMEESESKVKHKLFKWIQEHQNEFKLII